MKRGIVRYISPYQQLGVVLSEDNIAYEFDVSLLDLNTRSSLRCGREITFEVSNNGELAIGIQIAPEEAGLAKWLRWWRKLPIWNW